MPTIINADTATGGAIITGDTSGQLQLQSGGVTALTTNWRERRGGGQPHGSLERLLRQEVSHHRVLWLAISTAGVTGIPPAGRRRIRARTTLPQGR
jgi:hypothetical protein